MAPRKGKDKSEKKTPREKAQKAMARTAIAEPETTPDLLAGDAEDEGVVTTESAPVETPEFSTAEIVETPSEVPTVTPTPAASDEEEKPKGSAQKRWREKNRSKVQEYQKKWREKNKEKVKQIHTAYRKKNPEKVKEWQKASQARRKEKSAAEKPETSA